MQAPKFLLFHLIYGFVLFNYRVNSDEPSCFMVPSTKCADLKIGKKCAQSGDGNMYCCNVTDMNEITSHFGTSPVSGRILGFHLRDSALPKLDLSSLDALLPNLASFSITRSNITHISGAFYDRLSSLTCLNISQNSIQEIHPYILLKLKALKNIVMTNNRNISVLPEFSRDLKGFKLDVSGNYALQCKYLINLTLAHADQTMIFTSINKNSTICAPERGRLFTESSAVYVKMEQFDEVKEVSSDCPTINETNKCLCSVNTLDVADNKKFVYQVLVNCSHRSMTSLPNKLPFHTRILDISHNNIISLDGIGNKTFNNLLDLYADNNKITSLKPLEGTIFLYQFQNLSLRNNKIEQIQVYMLSNSFDRVKGARGILLGENEFKCDCQTASITKNWLLSNTEHVPDYNEIYTVCRNTRQRVIDLDQKDVCPKPTEMKDFIRFIIYGEITIFVLLIGKVSYDYYIFKTFAYLPWPASRMPKLPCDWCFET